MRTNPLKIPSFSLYGEAPAAAPHSNGVHIEDIQSRSRKYLWKIGAHRHILLSQCIWVSDGPVAAVLDARRADLSGPSVIIVPAGTVHGFKFGADTQGHVLTVDLARVLGAAGGAHQAPIEALFSAARGASPAAARAAGERAAAARQCGRAGRQLVGVQRAVDSGAGDRDARCRGSTRQPRRGAAAPIPSFDRIPLPQTLAGGTLRAPTGAVRYQLESTVPPIGRQYRLRSDPTAPGIGSPQAPGARRGFGERHRRRTRFQGSRLFLALLSAP